VEEVEEVEVHLIMQAVVEVEEVEAEVVEQFIYLIHH